MALSNAQREAVFVTRNRCINCHEPDLSVLDQGNFREGIVHDGILNSPQGEDPLPSLAKAEWVLKRCNSCTQIFQAHVLDEEWMNVAYSRWASAEAIAAFERMSGIASFSHQYRAGIDRTKHVVRLEKLTTEIRGGAAPRLLDFGCGRGEFVNACRNHGLEAYGVDFATSRMDSAVTKIVPSLDDVNGVFHAVTLFEVLEHVTNPADILGSLSARMVIGGILIVETPDCTGVTGIRSERDLQLVDPIQHINGYTPDTLTNIVERAGFKRIRRPVAIATAGPVGGTRSLIAHAIGRAERGTQQYFRKVA